MGNTNRSFKNIIKHHTLELDSLLHLLAKYMHVLFQLMFIDKSTSCYYNTIHCIETRLQDIQLAE